MNDTQTIPAINQDVDTILNIILKGGRTEAEAVFLAHIIVREVDRYFDELSATHDTTMN